MTTVLWSKDESERAGTPLLVMLHGYGTDETRMAALFDSMPGGLSCAAVRAPRDISGDYGWFLLDYFLNNDFADVIGAATGLLGWIDGARARYGFSSVNLLGYSQGMAMATTLLRLRPQAFTAAVGLSGFVLDNPLLAALEPLELKVPFYWGRDPADLVINPAAVRFTRGWLAENTTLTAAEYHGMGHRLGGEEVSDAAAFLTAVVPYSFQPNG
ncbi:MAG: alpha/beta hydrolase [Actinomycetales bacterium]